MRQSDTVVLEKLDIKRFHASRKYILRQSKQAEMDKHLQDIHITRIAQQPRYLESTSYMVQFQLQPCSRTPLTLRAFAATIRPEHMALLNAARVRWGSDRSMIFPFSSQRTCGFRHADGGHEVGCNNERERALIQIVHGSSTL